VTGIAESPLFRTTLGSIDVMMTDPRQPHRRAIADAAEATLSNGAAYAGFMALVEDSDYDDPKLEDLIDHIIHLPPRSRLFGLSPAAYDAHIERIRRLIAAARE
jgi:hypothetical protein